MQCAWVSKLSPLKEIIPSRCHMRHAASQRTSNEVHPISHKGYCVHHIFTWGCWYSDIWNIYIYIYIYIFSFMFIIYILVTVYFRVDLMERCWYLLQHLSEMNPRAPYWWSFNFGSGRGLVLLCPKPFPGPMFTKCVQWKSGRTVESADLADVKIWRYLLAKTSAISLSLTYPSTEFAVFLLTLLIFFNSVNYGLNTQPVITWTIEY